MKEDNADIIILEDFRKQVDADEGLSNKRRMVVIISSVLIGMFFTGATVKEANTFLLKIEFVNQEGLPLVLLFSLLYVTIRYNAYAENYRKTLKNLWANRFLLDPYIMRYGQKESSLEGLIGARLDKYADDENYRFIHDGAYSAPPFSLFKREIKCIEEKVMTSEYGDEEVVAFANKFTLTNWRNVKDYGFNLRLLWLEAKYQLDALITYRENLDILGPFILSGAASGLTVISLWS